MSATLLDFARMNDAVAATTRKLAKQQILSDYFKTLEEGDLRLAVRYAGGRAFASTDERVLGVSGAIVSDVILGMFRVDPREYHDRVVRAGEIGEALSQLVSQSSSPGTPGEGRGEGSHLTLRQLSELFDDLASTGNQANKRSIVRDLLQRCTGPREAAYLAKIIFSDLRTGAREGVIQAAVAHAFGQTLAQIQRCQLFVGDLDAVAVLAKKGALDCAVFKLFHPIQFMLAAPQEDASEAAKTMAGRTFFAEDKLDGIRAQVHKRADGRIAIYTRTMDRTDESFPDVVKSLQSLTGELLLDGEIVPWRDGKVLPFAHLQRRLGRKAITERIIRENPAAFIAFDMLYRDGQAMIDWPLRRRRAELEQLLPPLPVGEGRGEGVFEDQNPLKSASPLTLTLSQRERGSSASILTTRITEVSTAEQIDRAFCRARDYRNEGLVLKDPDSTYAPGRRGKAWLKLKTHLPTFDCVVTAAEYGHGKRRGVLSDYTFAVWDGEPRENGTKLVNIGKAYSGVTDQEIAQLTETFLKLSRQQVGGVHLVEPKIVLEIACDQIQRSDRHSSGYALRFPRIKRIRWDKRPEDADRLSRVAEVYDSIANFARREVIEVPPEPTLFDDL